MSDLISREALRKAFHNRIYYFDKSSWDEANTIIDNAPTVEPKQGEWIPVSERLPEEMQNALIWFEYHKFTKYGDFISICQTYGFGYVCDGKWSPFINGVTGWTDYNVIAWQPLPEPYHELGLFFKTYGITDAEQKGGSE